MSAANPNAELNSAKESSVVTQQEEGISSEDWDVVLRGDRTERIVTLFEGDQIIEEGTCSRMACYIVSGTCRVEKRLKDQDVSVVLGHLEAGDSFGEISFLTQSLATASVVADSNVELYVVDPCHYRSLFPDNSSVGLRLLHFLCKSLSRRIGQREMEGWGHNEQ